MPNNSSFDFEVVYSLRRVHELLTSRILWAEESYIYKQSVFIEILIHLKDLLLKASKLNSRVTLSNDIQIPNDLKIVDITDLISNFRDAVCHMDTFRKYYGEKSFSFIELRGKQTYKYENKIISLYDDDIAYVMGPHILYLHRHIERAFEEIKFVYKLYLGSNIYDFAFRLPDGG